MLYGLTEKRPTPALGAGVQTEYEKERYALAAIQAEYETVDSRSLKFLGDGTKVAGSGTSGSKTWYKRVFDPKLLDKGVFLLFELTPGISGWVQLVFVGSANAQNPDFRLAFDLPSHRLQIMYYDGARPSVPHYQDITGFIPKQFATERFVIVIRLGYVDEAKTIVYMDVELCNQIGGNHWGDSFSHRLTWTGDQYVKQGWKKVKSIYLTNKNQTTPLNVFFQA